MATVNLPYGVHDLDPTPVCVGNDPKRVRCFVRGCKHVVTVGRHGVGGDICPDHGIQCYHSTSGATFAYPDVQRNFIASPGTLAEKVIGHPFKYESHRLGLERSEDAVSWNVFRSLQEAGALAQVAKLIVGDCPLHEPFLFLWGLCLTDDDFTPWHLLQTARERFETQLPVDRPLTEPDIGLFLPGKYLILIEAKFTSRNTFYKSGSRKDARSLTMEELIAIYSDPALQILDQSLGRSANRIYQQLWRNTIFAEWMAREDHPKTKAYHVNLVRAGQDEASAVEFSGFIRPKYGDRFRRLTWEQLYQRFRHDNELGLLRLYLERKTAGLKKAFLLP